MTTGCKIDISLNGISVLEYFIKSSTERKITVFDNDLLTCYLNTVSVNIFWDNFLILIGFTVSDFGELEVPLTDTENHNYITSGTTVKNSLECGTVAHKVSQKICHFFTSPFVW